MTAMSVARGCLMVQPHQKLVLISTGQPQSTDLRPPLNMEVSFKIIKKLYFNLASFIDYGCSLYSLHNVLISYHA